jgi:stage IV sporulation protein FA
LSDGKKVGEAVKVRKTSSLNRVRAASKRRRKRLMRQLFRPLSPPSEDADAPVGAGGWSGKWESDYYQEGSLLTDPAVYERSDSRWDSARGKPSGGAFRARKWLLQGLFSLALVAAVWLIETSTHPRMAPVQYWVSEAVTRDFDFAAVQSWYERQFGSSPSFLPAFASNWLGSSAHAPTAEWQPLTGRVVKAFSPQHQGIRLSVTGAGAVHAVGTGWVVDVGERPGLGMTVVVQHPRGNQTWYARLEDVFVAEEDWVYAGDPIGRTGSDGEWFLALRQRDTFVDPAAVLPLAD